MTLLENPFFGIVGLLLVGALVIWLISSRYRVAKPNEAFVITGRSGKRTMNEAGQTTVDLSGQRVVRGGGAFIIPLIQQLSVMNLQSLRIEVSVPNGYAEGNIPLSVTGIAIVKVGDTDESIRAAAQRFGSQQDQIEQFCREVLTGTLRSVIGGMTALAINNDRATLAAKVAEMAENDLSGQGLVVDTLQIQDVQDTDGSTYLKDMGRPEQARVRQMADIAEAQAKQASEQAVAAADQIVAEAQQTLALKRAQIKATTDKAAAEAANAGPLEAAAQNQRLVTAQQLVAEQQAILTEKELNATIRKQADANRYKTETDAAASKARTIAEAEAAKASRLAAAEARQAEGVAEAAAIQAIGLANAAATTAQADALAKYGQAAMAKMVVDQLPAIASAIASPMAGIANMTVISTDGATDLTKKTIGLMAELPGVIEQLTGIKLGDLLNGFAGVAPQQPAAASPEVTGPVLEPAA